MFIRKEMRPDLSWHCLRTWTRVPGRAITLCGRSFTAVTRVELPADKTCETCLRISTKEG